MTLLDALKRLRDEGPDDPEEGICRDLKMSGVPPASFLNLATVWPEYSGMRPFPVPHPDEHADYAYLASKAEVMWDADQPYGAARWRLVRWAIAQLEQPCTGAAQIREQTDAPHVVRDKVREIILLAGDYDVIVHPLRDEDNFAGVSFDAEGGRGPFWVLSPKEMDGYVAQFGKKRVTWTEIPERTQAAIIRYLEK